MTLFPESLPPAEQPYPVPDNWMWVGFDTVLSNITSSSKKIQQHDYLQEGKIPVIDQGMEFIGGYTDDEQLKYNGALPIIIFGDHTRAVKYVDFVFVQGADGIKVLSPTVYSHGKFIYYCLKNLRIEDRGYRRHFKFLKESRFPLPPLPEQRRIAAKLDALIGKLREARTLIDEARESFALRRAAILHQAFSGKLTAQWRAEHPEMAASSDELFDGKLEEKPYQIPETWTWGSIGQIANVKGGKRLPKGEKLIKINTGHPYIKAGDLKNGTVLIAILRTVSCSNCSVIKQILIMRR